MQLRRLLPFIDIPNKVDIPYWQSGPLIPSTHLQVNVKRSIAIMQVPPLRHGSDSHGSKNYVHIQYDMHVKI